MPDSCAPSLQEESLPGEGAQTTETKERASLPGLLIEANRITRGKISNRSQLQQLTPEIIRWRKANIRILLTETKTTHHHQNYSTPTSPWPGNAKTLEKVVPYLKAYLRLMVEDIKNDFNNSLKEIQENTAK